MKFVDSITDLMAPGDMAKLTGLDFIKGIKDGKLPAPPICRTLNYWLTEVDEGRVVFESEPKFDAMNPLGTIHGGWFGTILDSCMACAVQTTLPKGFGYTTLEYKVNITRAIVPDGRLYRAIGTVDHSGRRTGVAQGEIRGVEDGKLYASGTTTCMKFPIG